LKSKYNTQEKRRVMCERGRVSAKEYITNSSVAPLFENPTSSLPAHPGDRVFLNGLRF
jgi:hypothetical protein